MNWRLFLFLLYILFYQINGSSAYSARSDSDSISIKNLKQIDISGDTLLTSIFNDVSDKVKYGITPAFYTVIMNRYKQGTMFAILRSKKDVFSRLGVILGYTIVNDHPFVIYSGVTDYHIPYVNEPEEKPFKLGYVDLIDDTDMVKYYYILGDVYARFSPEAGWIWSDSKPDE